MGEIGKPNFEDTPSNGQLEKGPTSNWAYDHAHDPDAHGNDLYPWLIPIDVFLTPKANTNWNTITISGSYLHNATKISDGSINAEIKWDIVLAKGTWKISIVLTKFTDSGIISVQLDSVEKGTMDLYAASVEWVALVDITGIVIPLTKKIELKLKMTNKNASASAYTGRISAIQLIRTA